MQNAVQVILSISIDGRMQGRKAKDAAILTMD